MTYQNLLWDRTPEGIVTLTLNRPDRLNSLTIATMDELDHAFAGLESDPASRGLILTGAGQKAFIAGADISELVDVTPRQFAARCVRDQAVMRRLETMGKPSIAAINGYALGGGLELALCCTLRVAAENARLGSPEVKLGVMPGNGGTHRLPLVVGKGRALEMMLTGRPVDAAEALRIGLVNHVVPQAGLLDFCRSLLASIIENAPLSVRMILECVDVGLRSGPEAGLRMEVTASELLAASEDRREGTRAFLEKRKPEYKGY